MDTASQVLELCRELGFDAAGAAPLRPPRGAARFRWWLAEGHHADMAWLERNAERIADPRRIRTDARGLLVVGLGHARARVTLRGGGLVARYAAGRDYHNRMGRMLRRLGRRLEEEGLARPVRGIVDAGPVLERSHAAEAGLGFESRAANLLNREHGPWMFLGELLLDREIGPASGPPEGSCGTCTACVDACPTDAIVADGVVDARRCISYHTIENRGHIPRALRASLSGWAFGCDVCSEVCPFGHGAPDRSGGHGTHPQVEGGSLVDWLGVGEEEFSERFRGSPLQRPRRAGLARNAALALAHHPSEAGRDALRSALARDPSPVVRAAAAWALDRAHGGDAGVRGDLSRAFEREDDAAAREDLGRTLGDER